DLDAARAGLRELQERWEAIGKVPRERMHDLEGKLRAIEKRVREAVDDQWRRTDPEAMARAAQFREKVAHFEEQAAKAEAAGRTRDAEQAREQAKQWREWAAAAEGAVSNRSPRAPSHPERRRPGCSTPGGAVGRRGSRRPGHPP